MGHINRTNPRTHPIPLGSSPELQFTMWEKYDKRIVFLTGASGFLGTVLVYRLVLTARVEHIYVLSRDTSRDKLK